MWFTLRLLLMALVTGISFSGSIAYPPFVGYKKENISSAATWGGGIIEGLQLMRQSWH
jgi:hypothetical protein